MNQNPSWRMFVVTVGAVELVAGCSGPTTPPPSAFFSAVNLDAIAKSCAPKDVTWGTNGTGQGGGGSPQSFHRNKECDAQFRCQSESLDQLMQALKKELQQAVKTHGGVVSGLKDLPGDARPIGFMFDYSVGSDSGRVRVAVEANKDAMRDEYPHQLTMRVDEPGTTSERGTSIPKK
jgi:hypothetical protein